MFLHPVSLYCSLMSFECKLNSVHLLSRVTTYCIGVVKREKNLNFHLHRLILSGIVCIASHIHFVITYSLLWFILINHLYFFIALFIYLFYLLFLFHFSFTAVCFPFCIFSFSILFFLLVFLCIFALFRLYI